MFLIRRLLLNVFVSRSFDKILSLDFLTDEQKEAIQEVRDKDFDVVAREAKAKIASDPKARAAMKAAEAGDGERPFLDWLFKEGGWKVIYGIVQMILLAFAIPLPPLPANVGELDAA